MSKELVQFLHSKLTPEHFFGAMMVLHSGGADADPAMDEPQYQGRAVPRTDRSSINAQDTAALRKRVAEAGLRGIQVADDHRASLGLSKIRNLGP